MGGNTVKMINLQVIKIMPDKNLIVVKGAVPGPNGSYVKVERWS
jgi:large subunit ribosomal protein L3